MASFTGCADWMRAQTILRNIWIALRFDDQPPKRPSFVVNRICLPGAPHTGGRGEQGRPGGELLDG